MTSKKDKAYFFLYDLVRNKWFSVAIVFAAVAVLIALAGCSSSSTSHHSMADRVSCVVKYHHWYDASGKKDIKAVESQLGPIDKAIRHHKRNELNRITVTLQNDTRTLQHDMPPSCVPGANSALTSLLTQLNEAAMFGRQNKMSDAQTALNEAGQSARQLGDAFKVYVK